MGKAASDVPEILEVADGPQCCFVRRRKRQVWNARACGANHGNRIAIRASGGAGRHGAARDQAARHCAAQHQGSERAPAPSLGAFAATSCGQDGRQAHSRTGNGTTSYSASGEAAGSHHPLPGAQAPRRRRRGSRPQGGLSTPAQAEAGSAVATAGLVRRLAARASKRSADPTRLAIWSSTSSSRARFNAAPPELRHSSASAAAPP